MVSPDYFRTLGIAVVAGRAFDSRDSAAADKTAVVNRALARFFFGNEDPIGRRIHYFKGEDQPDDDRRDRRGCDPAQPS